MVSVFLNERFATLPNKVKINRELVEVLLNCALQLSLSSTKQNGISVIISWLPQKSNQQVPRQNLDSVASNPVFVFPLAADQKQKPSQLRSEELRLPFPTVQSLETEPLSHKKNVMPGQNKSIEFSRMLHQSQLQPFSFSERPSEDICTDQL